MSIPVVAGWQYWDEFAAHSLIGITSVPADALLDETGAALLDETGAYLLEN